MDLIHGPPRKQPGTPRLFAGDGEGGFSPLHRDLFPGLSIDYGDAAAADLDADGRTDLAFAVHLRGLVVLLNRGERGFTQQASHRSADELRFSSRALAAGDLDGDGRPDLAVMGEGPALGAAHASSGARVLINRLPDRWRAIDLVPAVGRLFGDDIALGDFDGDGHLDVATDSRVQGQLGVIFWNAGQGTFEPAALDAAPSGGYLHALAAADFQGNSHDALAVAYLVPRGAGARIGLDLLSAAPDRRWRRQELAWTAQPGRPTALAAGDVDGDSDPDLVALTDTGAVVVFANRNGALSPAGGVTADLAGAGCRGFHVELADLDGDGSDEIVAGFAGEDCPGGGSLRAWSLARDPGR